MAIVISDKVDIRTKIVTRDKEEYCIMIKGSINQKDITVKKQIYRPGTVAHACNPSSFGG